MLVTVEVQYIGDPTVRSEVRAIIEYVWAERAGDWRVSIVGSQSNELWEMKIFGPNAFERSYALDGTAGQHDPRVIGQIVARMLPQ